MNIFDRKSKRFFEKRMCIDISAYEDRIVKYSKNDFTFFGELGRFLVESDIGSPDFIKDSAKLQARHNIKSEESIETAHVLTYAVKFFREIDGGLLASYVLIESENWQPLPKIEKSLYNEMHTADQEIYNNLPNSNITIYRGTSLDEYESGSFGQSWSLDKAQANLFAFNLQQEKDNCGVRVILSAMIDKEDIYAFSSHNQESLCIINPKKIIANTVKIET